MHTLHSILSALVTFSFIALIVGLIKPGLVLFWSNIKSRSRVLLYFGVMMIIFGTLTSWVADYDPQYIAEKEAKEATKIAEKLTAEAVKTEKVAEEQKRTEQQAEEMKKGAKKLVIQAHEISVNKKLYINDFINFDKKMNTMNKEAKDKTIGTYVRWMGKVNNVNIKDNRIGLFCRNQDKEWQSIVVTVVPEQADILKKLKEDDSIDFVAKIKVPKTGGTSIPYYLNEGVIMQYADIDLEKEALPD